MRCREHVWRAHTTSSFDLWAECVNCGEWRWNPYRIGRTS